MMAGGQCLNCGANGLAQYEREKARQKFFIDVEQGRHTVVGQFKNELQEEFVIFVTVGIDPKYSKGITGDEFDWEIGYFCDEAGNVFMPFSVTRIEREEIQKLFKSV